MYKLVLIILFIISSLRICGQEIQIEYTSFTESFKEESENIYVPFEYNRYSRNLSSKKGEINLVYDQDFPDSLRIAMDRSKDIWEHRIHTFHPIIISVGMESLDDKIVMDTEVGYIIGGNADILGCPVSLASQLCNCQMGTTSLPDARIKLSNKISWDISINNSPDVRYNAISIGMRGIAIALGFGSSVQRKGNLSSVFEFQNNFPSFFDKKIHNGELYLSELHSGTFQLTQFVKSNSLTIDGAIAEYDLYAPTIYEPQKSLVYLKNPTSIMSATFGCGNKIFSIDFATLDILNNLGWSIYDDMDRASIICDDLNDNDEGSVYLSHKFVLNEHADNASHFEWKLSVLSSTGEYEIIQESSDKYFESFAINDFSEFKIDSRGCILAKVECTYQNNNGQIIDAAPYFFSLWLKPEILNIRNVECSSVTPYSFIMKCIVDYIGSDHITVGVEEEFNTSYRTYVFTEPYSAHVVTGDISSLCYSWVDIMVKNDYGFMSNKLEFLPKYPAKESMLADSSFDGQQYTDKTVVYVFNLAGECIFKGDNLEFNTKQFPSGIYIKHETIAGEYIVSKIQLP